MNPSTAKILESLAVHPVRGFLPPADPLMQLPDAFSPWEELAEQLPKLLMTDQLRRLVATLPPIDAAGLQPAHLERAMMLLSYLGHAYVFNGPPVDRLPAPLAVPWHAVAKRLGRPPILSYASYASNNWRRIDPARDIEIGNIALLQNFGGGADEEWFILIHIDIERKAGPLLAGLLTAHQACAAPPAGDTTTLTTTLHTISAQQEAMYATLCRMPEWCDPYIYYHRVRPYIHGWKNNPTLPDGLIYEGVTDYAGKGQFFRGETGAQSSIVPAIDAVLGITHAPGQLNDYLLEMRTYMPPKHRAFIEHLEAGPNARTLLPTFPEETKAAYNRCVELQEAFRAKHYEYAASYIHKQSSHHQSTANPSAIGTGGTPFMPYLKKHLDETAEHKVH